MKNNSVLITGTCGFIAGNLVRHLAMGKRQVSSIDKGNKNDISSIYVNRAYHEFYLSNLNDSDILDQIFNIEKPDVIIHSANEGTQNLIDAARKYNVSKFIYLSDAIVYGASNNPLGSVCEDTKTNPSSDFAKFKKQEEDLIINSGLPFNIARLSNNYGQRQQKYELIPGLIRALNNKEQLTVLGPSSTKEWTHVHDTAAALSLLINSGKDNEIYNVSSNQEFSCLEVVHEVQSNLQKFHGIKANDLIKFDNKNNEYEYSVNSSKLKSLGFTPSIKFRDGIDDTISWFMSNKWSL